MIPDDHKYIIWKEGETNLIIFLKNFSINNWSKLFEIFSKYTEDNYTLIKKEDINQRQSQLQKLFVSFSPFCEDLDYFFEKYLNYC